MHRKVGLQGFKPAIRHPFIEIAKNQCRHGGAKSHRLDNGLQLCTPHLSRQAQMRGDDTYGAICHDKLDKNRTAWLESGHFDPINRLHGHTFSHQYRIPVPAQAGIVDRKFDRLQIGRAADLGAIQRGRAVAETLVGFLQCDDIGIQRRDHVKRPTGPALAVQPDAFAYVVRGNPERLLLLAHMIDMGKLHGNEKASDL